MVFDKGLASLFDGIKQAVAFIDCDLKTAYANVAFCEIFDVVKSEIVGILLADAVGDDMFRLCCPQLKLALDGKENQLVSDDFLSNHKTVALHRFIPSINAKGEVIGVYLHIEPVSPAHVNALSGMEINTTPQSYPYPSDSQLLDMNQPIGLGFWGLDVPSMRLYFSDKLIEDWQIQDDALHEHMDQAISRVYFEDREKVRSVLKATLEDGANYSVDYRILMPNGKFMWVESRAEVYKNEKGKVFRLLGTVHDITRRKQSEINIRDSEKRFRALADFLPQMIWTSDESGQFEYFNQKWLDYTAANLPRAIELGWMSYVHPDDKVRAEALWLKSLHSGEPYDCEFRLQRFYDRSFRWHRATALSLCDEHGRIVRWLGINADIHDHSQLVEQLTLAKREAEKATEVKTTFLANMSHEIRTPLSAIIGFANLLSDSSVDPASRARYLKIIDRNSKALSVLINDILDISKFEAGKFEIEHITFRIDSVIEEVVSIFSETAKGKGLNSRVEIADVEEFEVISDPARLRQILVNIIGNAHKFTDLGDIVIRLSSERQDTGLTRFFIEVEDTGIGLTKEQAQRLFEPFSQADQSTTRKFGGTGLGLVLSKRLAQALGGDVELVSFADHSGCTFRIWFDAETSRAEEVDRAPVDDAMFSFDALPKIERAVRVLLVEDAKENQFLLTEVLSKQGITVFVANNGLEALTITQEIQPDIILMDMQMPVMDGFEATRILRERGYAKPIIALTALVMAEDRVRIDKCGCDGYLTKPIDFSLLLATIDSFTR
ncbi:MAG: PAS domain-containing protein [Chitinophagaceae bacterium]|nr:PAS domain-containing protein [Oligoflexus sp.]